MQSGYGGQVLSNSLLFGRTLESSEHVQIGLIDATWGGTPVDAWMSIEGLTSDANFMPVFVNCEGFGRDGGNRGGETAG
jgi:hypothetical protein